MKAACNCGRKQADKDDPFDHKVSLGVKLLDGSVVEHEAYESFTCPCHNTPNMKAMCNCGCKQANKDDSFDHKVSQKFKIFVMVVWWLSGRASKRLLCVLSPHVTAL